MTAVGETKSSRLWSKETLKNLTDCSVWSGRINSSFDQPLITVPLSVLIKKRRNARGHCSVPAPQWTPTLLVAFHHISIWRKASMIALIRWSTRRLLMAGPDARKWEDTALVAAIAWKTIKKAAWSLVLDLLLCTSMFPPNLLNVYFCL